MSKVIITAPIGGSPISVKLWSYVTSPDTGKLVPLKFVGSIKDSSSSISYLFYSAPGYEEEDDYNWRA